MNIILYSIGNVHGTLSVLTYRNIEHFTMYKFSLYMYMYMYVFYSSTLPLPPSPSLPPSLSLSSRIDPDLNKPVKIFPLPHMFVVKDLVPVSTITIY